MVVASLRYEPLSRAVEETKGGVFVYDGSPERYHEWVFRTSMRWKSTKEEDRLNTMSMIIEGLIGEAAQVAMDLGLEALEDKQALDRLLAAMRNQVYPMAQVEAKELYRVGHKVKGVMS